MLRFVNRLCFTLGFRSDFVVLILRCGFVRFSSVRGRCRAFGGVWSSCIRALGIISAAFLHLRVPGFVPPCAGCKSVVSITRGRNGRSGVFVSSRFGRSMEADGLQPIPIFINGVEAHTVVRDLLTSPYEQQRRAQGAVDTPTLSPQCVEVRHECARNTDRRGQGVESPSSSLLLPGEALERRREGVCVFVLSLMLSSWSQVDAIVNTIGFPLVGGPAGSMEAGRRVDVATNLLSAKDVPYLVAAPLLIQDLVGWRRDGVQGLQQVQATRDDTPRSSCRLYVVDDTFSSLPCLEFEAL